MTISSLNNWSRNVKNVKKKHELFICRDHWYIRITLYDIKRLPLRAKRRYLWTKYPNKMKMLSLNIWSVNVENSTTKMGLNFQNCVVVTSNIYQSLYMRRTVFHFEQTVVVDEQNDHLKLKCRLWTSGQ